MTDYDAIRQRLHGMSDELRAEVERQVGRSVLNPEGEDDKRRRTGIERQAWLEIECARLAGDICQTDDRLAKGAETEPDMIAALQSRRDTLARMLDHCERAVRRAETHRAAEAAAEARSEGMRQERDAMHARLWRQVERFAGRKAERAPGDVPRYLRHAGR